MTTNRFRGSLLATTMIAGLAFAMPGHAQIQVPAEAQPEVVAATPPAEVVDAGDIVVTGSRIARPEL
jgi:hypothetical protein